jgi:hypothetical protein
VVYGPKKGTEIGGNGNPLMADGWRGLIPCEWNKEYWEKAWSKLSAY